MEGGLALPRGRNSGATLLEVLVTVTLVAVLLGSGLPALSKLILDNRRTATVNDLVHAVHRAKSEAHKRGLQTVLCGSADDGGCVEGTGEWPHGWLLFVNLDRDQPPRIDPGEPIIVKYSSAFEGTISANREAFVFRPFFTRGTNGTILFCDRRGGRHARNVIVSYTGRPRVAARNSRGKALSCRD